MGDRGGLGGGDCGCLVIGSADCTAAGTVGAGNDLGALEGVSVGVFRKKQKSRFAKSLRRDMASSSRARRSSWSLSNRVAKSDLVLGGVKLREDVAAGMSGGSM